MLDWLADSELQDTEFWTDITIAANLDTSVLKTISSVIATKDDVFSSVGTAKIRTMVENMGASYEDIVKALKSLIFVTEKMVENDNSIDDVLMSIQEHGVEGVDSVDRLRLNIAEIKDTLSDRVRFHKLFESEIGKTFPVLEGHIGRVREVVVFDNELVIGENVEDYDPGEIHTRSIGVITIQVNSFGRTEVVSFAVRKEKLVDLAELCRGLIYQIELLEKKGG